MDASGLSANFEKLGYKSRINFIGLCGATVSLVRTTNAIARIQHKSPDIVLVLLEGRPLSHGALGDQG